MKGAGGEEQVSGLIRQDLKRDDFWDSQLEEKRSGGPKTTSTKLKVLPGGEERVKVY